MTHLFSRVLLLFLFLFFLPLFAAWLYMAQPTFSHNQPSLHAADPEQLKAHVQKMSTDFHPRNYLHPGNLDACADYISDFFSKAGALTSRQTYEVAGKTYQNVIGQFGDPHSNQGRWIIGAHYDSCMDTPGADDNASGVAGLMELARLLSSHPNPPPVELVAYTLEEPPFFRTPDMGSARHARSVVESGIPVKGVMILEMIGRFDARPGTQDYPIGLLKLFYPRRGDFLLVVGHLGQRAFTKDVKIGMKNTSNLAVYSINAPLSLPGVDFSDHLNYWEQNLPAVMITDTAFYRNKHYHTDKDTWDRLNYTEMAKSVVAVYESLLRMDKAL